MARRWVTATIVPAALCAVVVFLTFAATDSGVITGAEGLLVVTLALFGCPFFIGRVQARIVAPRGVPAGSWRRSTGFGSFFIDFGMWFLIGFSLLDKWHAGVGSTAAPFTDVNRRLFLQSLDADVFWVLTLGACAAFLGVAQGDVLRR